MAPEELSRPGQAADGSTRWDVAACTAFAIALLERAGEVGDAQAAERAVESAAEVLAHVAGGDGPLGAVAVVAELTPSEVMTLAFCVGVEVDGRAQSLVGDLQGDPRLVNPRLDLLDRVLGGDTLLTLAEEARLVSAGLLDLRPGATFIATQVVVPPRVVWALLDDVALDPELAAGAAVLTVGPDQPGRHDLVLVHGADPVRRRQTAVHACAGLAFVVLPPPESDRGWRTLVRTATLGGLGVVLEPAGGQLPASAREAIERADHLSFAVCTAQPLDLSQAPRRSAIELAAPDAVVTPSEWEAVFETTTPSRLPSAAQLSLAERAPLNVHDPDEVMRRVTTGTLLKHATRIVPKVAWDDLVLPESQEHQLRALVDRYRQRSRVHDDWGLSLYPSPGVVALFSGPSGTGKTTSAEVIAHELGMDMFRVDLSALVSKYIGETEKNLEEIFSAAHTGNYLLLFDEADSLFGSRSKVEDSKDRYANMEVSYLLQRLETYDGVVVLTSNFQGNIDQAFLRRIHVTVHFPVPSAEERERIWDRALGRAPRVDLDLAFVARQFDLTGGSIRNAALTAAFTAAARADSGDGGDRGEPGVDMVDLLRAVATEMTKLGRRVQDAQLGPWLEAVSSTPVHPAK